MGRTGALREATALSLCHPLLLKEIILQADWNDRVIIVPCVLSYVWDRGKREKKGELEKESCWFQSQNRKERAAREETGNRGHILWTQSNPGAARLQRTHVDFPAANHP